MPAASEKKDCMEIALAQDISGKYAPHQRPMEIEQVSMEEEPQQLEQPAAVVPPPVQLLADTETVIIFDWDDTLLASSYLASKGYRLDNNMVRCPDVEAQLRLLERSICNVLTLAMRYGHVHVVTNAETGWVHLSAQKFVPAVMPLLDQVTVLSARSTYEHAYPQSPLQWKVCAFHDRLAPHLAEGDRVTKNVISFGDSHVEREAVRTVTRGLSKTKTKSVKFAERPSMEQLRRQIDLVTNCFHYIYSHEGDLDLMLTISLMV